MSKSLLVKTVALSSLIGIILNGMVVSQLANASYDNLKFCRVIRGSYEVAKSVHMIVTAYTSSPEETDDTPFITASGKYVEDGIIANNLLPFGTKVMIPELYGDKIFIVEDRMHSRKGKYQADIWMANKSEARIFGAKVVNIEIIES